MDMLREQFFAIQSKRRKLELRHRASPWQRNLGYPLAMLGLLALTGISVLIVCFHVLELLLDDAAMPRGIQDASLGQVSFSIFGSFGAALQVVLIFYLMVSSVVGFYSSPLFTRLLPERQDTPLTKVGAMGWGWGAPEGVQDPVPHSVSLCTACGVPVWESSVPLPGRTPSQCSLAFGKLLPQPGGSLQQHCPPKPPPSPQIIGNCVSLLVLSSALPVFSRTLGITRFDLLGDFGRFNWLGNFYIVFLYNMGFAGLTTLCLVKRVSWAVQAELIRAFGEDRDMGTQGWVLGCPLSPTLALTLSLYPGLHKLPLPVTRCRTRSKPC
ncbi:hypothetical protein Nmel_018923 [Mimus melanotis]